MISFTNIQNLDIFTCFINQYKHMINEQNNHVTITINGINERHSLSGVVNIKNTPFATNPKSTPFVIVKNEQICIQLNLTQGEQYAMIAHEIGHILDESERDENNRILNEYKADQFAVSLKLSTELKSGLERIIASGIDPDQVDGLTNRLNRLSDLAEAGILASKFSAKTRSIASLRSSAEGAF